MPRTDQKLLQGVKMTRGGFVGKPGRKWFFQGPSRKGQMGTLKMAMIFFGFQKVFFTSSDFALKNKTLKRLPTSCIIHYPCPHWDWHFRMEAVIKHTEDPAVNS